MGTGPVEAHRALCSEEPHIWGLMLCSRHHEVLKNLIFEFVFHKWNPVGQRGMHQRLGALAHALSPTSDDSLPPRDQLEPPTPPTLVRWALPGLPSCPATTGTLVPGGSLGQGMGRIRVGHSALGGGSGSWPHPRVETPWPRGKPLTSPQI